MHIAILTFDGFNELDSLIALGILNRAAEPEWSVAITSPTETVTSMNGVVLHAQARLDTVASADVVLVGSGVGTREVVRDRDLMAQLHLDPTRQLIGAQCSGALVLATLGLLRDVPACTDLTTKPWVVESGVQVLDQPFFAKGNVATAGGCLAAQYLATWVIARVAGTDAAAAAMRYVAPVGEKEQYVQRALAQVTPYLDAPS